MVKSLGIFLFLCFPQTQIKRNNILLDMIVLSLSLIDFAFLREQSSMKCVSVIAVSSVNLNLNKSKIIMFEPKHDLKILPSMHTLTSEANI